MQRVMAYVDGFNLYFGLKDSSFKRYYWLDVSALAQSLLKPGQQLLATHDFTARIRANGRNSADQKRQNDYLEALALRGVRCQFGHYLQKTRQCRQCGAAPASCQNNSSSPMATCSHALPPGAEGLQE